VVGRTDSPPDGVAGILSVPFLVPGETHPRSAGYKKSTDADAMTSRYLICVLLVGCTAGPKSAPPPDAGGETEHTQEDVSGRCIREATVTVHVENGSGSDVAIAFGAYAPTRAAPAMSRTTYRVPRYYLQGYITLRIERGGLEVSPAPPVATEFVVCNDATLVIGPRPRYSFFYGDLLRRPTRTPESDDPDSTSVGR